MEAQEVIHVHDLCIYIDEIRGIIGLMSLEIVPLMLSVVTLVRS